MEKKSILHLFGCCPQGLLILSLVYPLWQSTTIQSIMEIRICCVKIDAITLMVCLLLSRRAT